MTSEEYDAALRSLPFMACDRCKTHPKKMSAYCDDGSWHLYANCECEGLGVEIPWPFAGKDTATAEEMRALGFETPQFSTPSEHDKPKNTAKHLYLVIDKNGTGYVTADIQMAYYAKNGTTPAPYRGVNPLAHALRELIEDGDFGPVEVREIDLPTSVDVVA